MMEALVTFNLVYTVTRRLAQNSRFLFLSYQKYHPSSDVTNFEYLKIAFLHPTFIHHEYTGYPAPLIGLM
jgi:hypothetical protein